MPQCYNDLSHATVLQITTKVAVLIWQSFESPRLNKHELPFFVKMLSTLDYMIYIMQILSTKENNCYFCETDVFFFV